MRRRVLSALVLLLVPALAASARAQEVGQVNRAQDALGIFAEKTWPLQATEPVRLGLTISLPKKISLVDVGFDVPVSISLPAGHAAPAGCPETALAGCFHSQGPKGVFTIQEARREEDKKLILGLKLDRGALWMALSHLIPHQVWILTDQLKAFSDGTTFRMLVDPVIGTFLATDEGEVKATLTDDSGEHFNVTAGHWLLVPPKGTIQRGASDRVPSGLDDPPLLDCCDPRSGPP